MVGSALSSAIGTSSSSTKVSGNLPTSSKQFDPGKCNPSNGMAFGASFQYSTGGGDSFGAKEKAALDNALQTSLEVSLGSSLGSSLRRSLAYSIGKTVGKTVGPPLGERDGTAIGTSLGASLGSSLGTSLGTALGEALKESNAIHNQKHKEVEVSSVSSSVVEPKTLLFESTDGISPQDGSTTRCPTLEVVLDEDGLTIGDIQERLYKLQ